MSLASQFAAVAPLAVLAVWTLVLLLIESAIPAPGARARAAANLTLVGIGLAGVALVWTAPGAEPVAVFSGMVVHDRMGAALSGVFLLGGFLVTLLGASTLDRARADTPEYHPLLLLALCGMIVVAQAGDLVTMFLGIETMSVAAYALCGTERKSARSAEAALKYFLLGAFASGFLLYGIALCYGATGTTNLSGIASAVADVPRDPRLLIGMLLMLVAIGFKVAAVPFHMWAPDVYEGAPTPVTALMASAVKAASFAAALRVFAGAFSQTEMLYGAAGWASVLAALAVATMTVGNLAALRQDSVKRMLAWSSVAHAGYLLVGLIAAGVVGAEGKASVLFYLLAYTVMTVGSFGVVAWLGGSAAERLDAYNGLGSRRPVAALAMTLFLLSLAGMPPTAGFVAKLYVFRAALQSPLLTWLVVVAVLNSLVSVYYYLRVVVAMYFREPEGEADAAAAGAPATAALCIAAAAVLLGGVLPGRWIEWAQQAVGLLAAAGSDPTHLSGF
jgi:NADH-quinone oxidoreductase subunit N